MLATSRRAVIALLSVGAALAAGLRGAIARTPDQTAGPFYPLPEHRLSDTDADLVRVAGAVREAGGEILHLSGVVRDAAGSPLRGALVEIWQCDVDGRYMHPRDRGGEIDPGFQGYGALRTGADGHYAFRTIRPTAYPGRTPHIHARVTAPGQRPLTTQLYVAGDPRNDRDFIFARLGAEGQAAASFTLARRADGDLAGEIDLVL